jgi:hypothetical protein
MYRIDGIYNSGYAHAPALIVNPSGSYPLIYNSTTGILQQTPNDQKVDKASEVEFKSVKTATVKSLTGTDAALIDSVGSIFAQNGLWSNLGVTIGDLGIKSLNAGTYGITATGLHDKLSIYSTKGVQIGFANNNFLFEPANMLFQGPSFRLPTGASVWTSKIDSVTGQSAITIADNGTVSIPSIILPATGIFKTLEVSNLPTQTGRFSITQANGTDYFFIKTTSFDGDHSLDIWATSIRNRDGTGGLLLDNNSSLTTFLAQVNNFTYGVYLNNNIYSDNKVSRLWYDPNLSNLNLETTGLKVTVSTNFSKVELNDQSIILANKVGAGSFTDTAAFSNTKIDLYKNTQVHGYINATTFYKNLIQVFPPNQSCDTTSSPSFVSVDATAYKLNGAAITFPTQALNTTSSPTFAGLTTVPVSPSTKAPILTSSTEGAPTNSNPNGNGADLDVFDLRIRSGRLFTTAATLQLGKKFSCDKQFNITGNNGTTVDPFVSLVGALQLRIGTTNFPSALIVNSDTGVVSIKDLQVTNTNQPIKALGGVETPEFVKTETLHANKWVYNIGTSLDVVQAFSTSTGPNFVSGIRVNNIKRPDGTQTYIDMNGARPSFPLGLDATLSATSSAPSVVTYNSTTKTLGYTTIPSNIPAYIRFAQNPEVLFNNSEAYNNMIQTYVASYVSSTTYKLTYQAFGGYPPLVENATTLTITPAGFYPNTFVSFQWQTPVESTNFPNVWENNVKQKFPALGSYMITWNYTMYDRRRCLISINKNFNIFSGSDNAAGNDPTSLAVVEHYTTAVENGSQITALVNITSLSDYVTYTIYNYDARTYMINQGRGALSITKVG